MTPSPLLRLIHSHRIAWFGLLLLVAAGGLFLTMAKHKTAAMEARLFESLINNAAQRIEADFDAFFAPVVDNLNIIRRWTEKESVVLSKPSGFNQTFIPILEQYPQISALILASSTGHEYFLLNEHGVWLTRNTRPEQGEDRVLWSRWSSPSTLDQQWAGKSDYDPRTRPWFKGAMRLKAPGDRYWTSPYTFFTLQEPGITVSTRTTTVDGTSLVVGFDVLLKAIALTTTSAQLGENGRVFALTNDGRILGPPRNPQFDNDPEALKKAILSPASSLDIAELSSALETWTALDKPLGKPFTFNIGKDIWWGVFRNFPRGERGFRIGYVVPQSDFHDEIGIGDNLYLWGGTGLVTLALAAFLLSFLALRRSPWGLEAGIKDQGDGFGPCTADKVRQLLTEGEGENIEFKSTLRWNLNTDKAGKEVEMSWLKTVVAFLNSKGGYLLVGVDDDCQILGIEADRFANEDKYLLHVNNLINQHIGLERSPYIRFSLVEIDDKKVLVVRCERSKAPVFLSMGKDEEFYIRTGPGSRKLPPSKIVPYLEERAP